MNQSALHKLSYGLYIISSSYDGKDVGCVANTLHQVTSSPIQLAVTLNKDNMTEQIIEQSGVFNAVVLTQDVSMDIIKVFGFTSSKDRNKYEAVPHARDIQNIPYITEHTSAQFTCKVVKQVDLGTHVMFVGEVVDCDVLCKEEVMTYAYYHTVKNGGTPKNAPSFQQSEVKTGWRCTICGYIYEGETLPEDYLCPLCQAPASCFEKVS